MQTRKPLEAFCSAELTLHEQHRSNCTTLSSFTHLHVLMDVCVFLCMGGAPSGVFSTRLARNPNQTIWVLWRFKFQTFLLPSSLRLCLLFSCSRLGGKIPPFVFCSHKCHIPPNLWPYSAFTLLGVPWQRVAPTQVSHPHLALFFCFVFFNRAILSLLIPFLSFSVGRIKETFSMWRRAWNFLRDLPGDTADHQAPWTTVCVCACVH